MFKNITKSGIFVWVLFIGTILLSLIRIGVSHPANEYQNMLGTKLTMSGIIVSDPKIQGRKTSFEVIPDAKDISDASGNSFSQGALLTQKDTVPQKIISQKILVSTFQKQNFGYGNRVYLAGKLKEPQPLSDFDYPKYLAAKNIYAQMSPSEIYVLEKTKQNPFIYYGLIAKHFIFGQLQKYLPPDAAAIIIALMSGQKDFLSADITNAFNLTGTAHMIAVSGYKLTLVIVSLEALSPYIGRKKVLAISIIFCWLYLVMADFAPAVMRAVIMSGLFLWASNAGRPYNLKNALLVTAAALMLFNPEIILYDVGFLLSVSGILGIIYFGPIIRVFLKGVPHFFGVKEVFVSTMSAQLATFPIMIYFFHQLSPIAPLANLLVVPLLSPCILAGYATAVPFAGRIAAFVLLPVLNYMAIVVETLVSLPYAYFFMNISLFWLAGIYVIEIALLFWAHRWLNRSQNFVTIHKYIKEKL